MKEATQSIAGIEISFLYDEDINKAKENGSIRFHVHHGSLPNMEPKDILFDSGQTWALFRSDDKYVLQDNTLQFDPCPEIYIILNSDLRSGDIFIDRDPSTTDLTDPLGWPMNQILMIYLLSQDRGALFHACGIDDRGRGILFMGNSGHGKSTMGKLWLENGCTVLNDDRIVIREKEGQFWMYGTPWHGDLAEWSLDSIPIHKIFFLNRDGKKTVIPKNGVEAVSMLLARAFPPFWDQESMAYTMDLCHRVVEKVPCHELSFEPDERIVDIIRGM